MKCLSIAVLAALASACATVTPRQDLVGSAAPAHAATRTVAITPDTTSINVSGGDVVRFVAGGREFAWDFHASPLIAVFALNQVAPAGMLEREVLVYVSPDPTYYQGSQIYALSHMAGH